MKGDLIVVGGQYVVALKPKHILIPDTDVTYLERYAQLHARDQGALPKAALAEYERLRKALGVIGPDTRKPSDRYAALTSRIKRCEGIYSIGNEFKVAVGDPLAGKWVGTIATVTGKRSRTEIYVEADFRGQEKTLFDPPVADAFDPSMSEEDDIEEDASDEEVDEWWDSRYDGLWDPAGTLTAVVPPQAIRHLYDDGLLERLSAEWQEQLRRYRAESDRRLRAYEERRRAREERDAAKLMEEAADSILREANRPPDDEWKPLA